MKEIEKEVIKMTGKAKKAIGYVCDIPIPGTDLVISKEDQRLRILKFAEKENLELIAIYEDEAFTEDFMNRPGVKKILECPERFEVVLVERVWCLSRKRKEIEPFLKRLDARDVELVCSSYLWDCLSQAVRHRYMGSLAEKRRQLAKARALAKTGKEAA